jgi:hypothetical protein
LVPREVTTLREISELENLLQDGCGDAAAQARAVKKLALLRTRIEAGYYEKALNRLGR